LVAVFPAEVLLFLPRELFPATPFVTLVFLEVETGTAIVAAILPLRPKKLESKRFIFPDASPTAEAKLEAFALVVRGRAPAGLVSIRQRLSGWPVFQLLRSLR